MPCTPLPPLPKDHVIDIDVELTFQYERLRMIFNDDQEHPYLRGFKQAMDTIKQYNNANTTTNTKRI